MTNDQMREEFEKWAVSIGLTLRGDNGNYLKEIQCAWMAWQASRAALCVKLPFVRCYPPNEASSDVDYWIDEARSIAVCECRTAIESAGVRTK